MAANLFLQYIESKSSPIAIEEAIQDRTSTQGMTPKAIRTLKGAASGGKKAGLAKIVVVAARGGGHRSHVSGTEWDIKGYNADGSLWRQDQRMMVAEGAHRAGADRFGIYEMDRGVGKETLHIGYSGGGRSAAIWGKNGLFSGEDSRKFTDPAEKAFVDVFNAGNLLGIDLEQDAPIPGTNPFIRSTNGGIAGAPGIPPLERATKQPDRKTAFPDSVAPQDLTSETLYNSAGAQHLRAQQRLAGSNIFSSPKRILTPSSTGPAPADTVNRATKGDRQSTSEERVFYGPEDSAGAGAFTSSFPESTLPTDRFIRSEPAGAAASDKRSQVSPKYYLPILKPNPLAMRSKSRSLGPDLPRDQPTVAALQDSAAIDEFIMSAARAIVEEKQSSRGGRRSGLGLARLIKPTSAIG